MLQRKKHGVRLDDGDILAPKAPEGLGGEMTLSNFREEEIVEYYQTSGPRSYFMSVNGGTETELDLNGTTFSDPVPTVVNVQLKAGANTISFGNANGYAPDLDRIVVAPKY